MEQRPVEKIVNDDQCFWNYRPLQRPLSISHDLSSVSALSMHYSPRKTGDEKRGEWSSDGEKEGIALCYLSLTRSSSLLTAVSYFPLFSSCPSGMTHARYWPSPLYLPSIVVWTGEDKEEERKREDCPDCIAFRRHLFLRSSRPTTYLQEWTVRAIPHFLSLPWASSSCRTLASLAVRQYLKLFS